MKKVELLAPAGSLESLYAAINAGADAVYMGGSKFSARAYASNFNNEELEKVVDYCHIYGAKVYITLNTLIKEKEIKEALEYANFLYSIGVDALIVQDAGLSYLIKKYLPDLEIHASTQMTVHNGEACLFLKDKGFERIVLSRELSLQDIKYISKDLNIETEIFVHGALCICYSGQCLMSSIIGGRSGNRGRCAQPCRLPYTIINIKGDVSRSAYLLSPKDICTIDNVADLINTGTSSFKIEGRMKRPEYVAGVVESYKRALDNQYNKASANLETENRKLLQLFNREGFSKAYLYKNQGKDMMAATYPKNTGIFLGKILKDNSIILTCEISLGDGIRNGDSGFTVSKIIKDNKEVSSAKEGDKVKLFPSAYKKGDELYKTLDNNLMKSYEELYKNPYFKKIYIKANVEFLIDKPIKIIASYNNKVYEIEGDIVQKALNKPLDKNKIEENIKKFSDSPFKINEISFISYEQGFLPISSVNSLRRKIIETIENDVKIMYKRNKGEITLKEKSLISNNSLNYMISACSKEQLKALIDMKVENIIVNPFFRFKGALKEDDLGAISQGYFLKVPNILKERELKYVCKVIDNNKSLIKGLVTANLGIINIYKNQFKIIGDYKLNIYNSHNLNFYNDLHLACLSIELNSKEIKDFVAVNNNAQMLIYGRPELMISEYCPIGSFIGEKCSNSNCNLECEKDFYLLKDRKDENFILRTDKFCRSYIYNPSVLNLLGEKNELIKMGINSFRIDFIDENYEEAIAVLKSLLLSSVNLKLNTYTKGHYRRGVE